MLSTNAMVIIHWQHHMHPAWQLFISNAYITLYSRSKQQFVLEYRPRSSSYSLRHNTMHMIAFCLLVSHKDSLGHSVVTHNHTDKSFRWSQSTWRWFASTATTSTQTSLSSHCYTRLLPFCKGDGTLDCSFVAVNVDLAISTQAFLPSNGTLGHFLHLVEEVNALALPCVERNK